MHDFSFLNPVHWLVGDIIAIPAGNTADNGVSRCVLSCSPCSAGKVAHCEHKLVDVADTHCSRTG